MTCYWGYKPRILIDWTRTCFLSSMYIISIMAVIVKKVKLRCKLLELFGKASQMVYYYCASGFVYSNINDRRLQLVISLVICLVSGTVFYFMEMPITNWLKEKVDALINKKLILAEI